MWWDWITLPKLCIHSGRHSKWTMVFSVESGTLRGLVEVQGLQAVAPSEIRQRILQSLHNSPSGGHLGRTKTLLRVRKRFFWSHYKEDVIRWCKRCDACARSKSGPVRKRAKLGHVPVGAPLERVAMDIMGPLPQTDNGHEYLLVVGDYFSKWAEASGSYSPNCGRCPGWVICKSLWFVQNSPLWSGQWIWVSIKSRTVSTFACQEDANCAL